MNRHGLIIKELEARSELERVVVICPRPLVAERKWELEMKRFDEEFTALVDNEEVLFDCIRASFNQRRKTLSNGLKNYPKLNLDKEQITKALSKANLRQDIRGEVLTLDEFIELSNIINQIQNGDE